MTLTEPFFLSLLAALPSASMTSSTVPWDLALFELFFGALEPSTASLPGPLTLASSLPVPFFLLPGFGARCQARRRSFSGSNSAPFEMVAVVLSPRIVTSTGSREVAIPVGR